MIEGCGDQSAGPAASSLKGGVPVAEPVLDLAKATAEEGEIAHRHARQHAAERKAREAFSEALGKRRQFAEGPLLRFPRKSLAARIAQEQHPPAGGEGKAGEQRRRSPVRAPAAVQQEAAAGEGRDAETGAPAAQGEPGHLVGPERASRERCENPAHGEGELGSRAEAGMGRDGLEDADLHRPVAEERPQALQQQRDAFGFRSLDAGAGGRMCPDQRRRPIDGEPEPEKASPDSPGGIEEAEVQPGGRPDLHGRRTASHAVQAFASLVASRGDVMLPAVRANREAAAMADRRTLKVYTEEEAAERLARELPTWYVERGWIRRRYRTYSWKGTLMVINTVGHLAEAAWHHPDITASYAWVEVRLRTHDHQGITDKDFALAKKIEEVIMWRPEPPLEGTPEKDLRFAYIRYDRPKESEGGTGSQAEDGGSGGSSG